MTQVMNKTARRGRPTAFANKFAVIDALVQVRDGGADQPSYYLKRKLVTAGLLEVVRVKVTEGRGAPQAHFQVSGMGRSRLALSKNWKR